MLVKNIQEKTYRLPDKLNPFQEEMYVHLINWKWTHISKVPGLYKGYFYDAIIPKEKRQMLPLLYQGVREMVNAHLDRYPFKLHEHFNHMASSQAANMNLFIPVLANENCDNILRKIKKDFCYLANNELFNGFRIEYWAENEQNNKSILGDHSPFAGTDADIAIAYYNYDEELCLWLIEHKLTEPEFTTCGGAKSRGRKIQHNCNATFSEILNNRNLCYYHSGTSFKYWDITNDNQSFFANHPQEGCPFKGGMNQLWRNQLMGLALEKRGDYKHVYFSVVHHPDNHSLENSINQYKELINHNPKFSTLTSKDVLEAAVAINNPKLAEWVSWYKELYKVR